MNTNDIISTEELASIEQYLLHQHDTEERIAFEKKMATDEAWAAKVKEVSLLLTGIETACLEEQLNDWHKNLQNNTQQKTQSKLFFLSRKLLVAASVALVAALSVWLYTSTPNKYEKLYASYYKPDPGLMSAMGIGDNYLFNKAMLNYKTGKYKQAISEWNKLKTSTSKNDTLNYFLGAAQQADGNSAAALALLQSIAADPANPFYKDACWYTGLALLKQGQVSESIPYLEKSGYPGSSELISKLK